MQVPIIAGIYTDNDGDYRTAYPKNLIAVPKQQGISAGYLRPAEGIVKKSDLQGDDRGGINWDGVHYRAIGSDLCKVDIDGAITTIGAIGGNSQCSFDYSFDHLAVASSNNLFLYNKSSLQQVTDTDLGDCIDLIFVDGYFMSTDGESIVVTELSDPFSVNPLKYGSAEIDPDPIKALIKVRNEPHAIGRYTIEVFTNTGGSNFPFSRIEGGQIQKGAVGTHACCNFMDSIAILGGGRNEPVSIYLCANGTASKIATREIDTIIQSFSEESLSDVLVEHRSDRGHEFIYIHLPDRTLLYDAAASRTMQRSVWSVLTTSIEGYAAYQGRSLVYVHGSWYCGYKKKIGKLSFSESGHFSEKVGWEFSTLLIFNEAKGVILHKIELTGIKGINISRGTLWTSYSIDGLSFSNESPLLSAKHGNTGKKIAWFMGGIMKKQRIQKFRGDSDTHMSFSRLDIEMEALSV